MLKDDPAQWEAWNRMFARCDDSIGKLLDLDKEHHLLEFLSPHGKRQGSRKQWSHSGGVRTNLDIPLAEDNNPNAVRDPGNYCYGVVMRLFGALFAEGSWQCYAYTEELNDTTLGDILEAALGFAWLCRNRRLACSPEELVILNTYTKVIEQCVVNTERVLVHVEAIGIWTDSKSLRERLI